ncbi:carboxypeptidase-like regulatory domain-containing protein [Dyadobacter fanqingshengii]|uniref:Carboxypeptidase-like regulatory domain-containing protein n=1 Tax=Dyadobacter fanqingshengii TaxID=2906443 RepID=A0A9X1PBT5_9BACT|nr:carboxypeptidase-like regulatory domain-containing protein [Dyadobacter fanqingshengii]MCF0041324.1 carboxypeptidase-like regulatory domain-containing protein [Dyadobacter fanqingshengii]USJ36953.1 carboxypeptidase-like regulatory domain-containing protein [Dyadobacter fanqingshengii]
MKKILQVTFILLFPLFAYSQSFIVSGTVKNQQNEAVPFAAVSVNKSLDSSLVKADVADDGGTFKVAGIAAGSGLFYQFKKHAWFQRRRPYK